MTRQREDDLRIEAIGRGLAGWALGLGLLRLHVAVFTVGAVGLVLLDLYRTPESLAAGLPLRLWVVILACHAAALAAGWATWHAVRPHRLANPSGAATPRALTPPAVSANAQLVPPPGRPTATWNGTARNGQTPATSIPVGPQPARVPVPSNGTAPDPVPLAPRGRFTPPTSAPPVVGHGGLGRVGMVEATTRLRAGASEVAAAGQTGWRRIARATRTSTRALASRLTLTQQAPGQPSEPQAVQAPATSPPPGPPASPMGAGMPPGWEGAVRPPDRPADPAAVAAQPAPAAGWPPPVHGSISTVRPDSSESGSDPSVMTPRPPHAPVEPPAADASPVPAETEWTWMEAAAAAWLARRDDEAGQPGPPNGSPVPASPSDGPDGSTPRS